MSDPASPSTTSRPPPTAPLAVTIAWLVVGLPAAWGVYQTVMKSKNLFFPPAATAVATTAPATAPAR